MTSRGRKPLPASIHALNGNPSQLTDAELEKRNAAQPPEGVLVPPTWLTPEGLTVWHAAIPLLVAMGTAGVVDVQALGRYCDGVVLWQRAQAFLHANGSTYPIRAKEPIEVEQPDGKGGKVKVKQYPITSVAQYPQVSEYRQLSKLLLTFEAEFGMTAAGRTRVEVYPGGTGGPRTKDEQNRANFFASGGSGPIPFRADGRPAS